MKPDLSGEHVRAYMSDAMGLIDSATSAVDEFLSRSAGAFAAERDDDTVRVGDVRRSVETLAAALRSADAADPTAKVHAEFLAGLLEAALQPVSADHE